MFDFNNNDSDKEMMDLDFRNEFDGDEEEEYDEDIDLLDEDDFDSVLDLFDDEERNERFCAIGEEINSIQRQLQADPGMKELFIINKRIEELEEQLADFDDYDND